jgi:CubicO group peptidase (beta-lactamase class C family)
MWKPQVEIPWGGIYQHWGYGWGISDVDDHHLVFWGGGHIGAPNAYYLAPEENLAVYVAANRSREAAKGTEYADEIAFPIIKMLLADQEAAPVSALPEDHVAKIEAIVK